jgi:glycosyltransferase involved in cell wall biosynthesis
MKIGIYISPAHPVPPDPDKILAPWVLAMDQVNTLVADGHEVHLFAALGSNTLGVLHDYGVSPLVRKQQDFTPEEYRQMVTAVEQDFFLKTIKTAHEIGLEVLHIHHPIERLYEQFAQSRRDIPLVFTFHDPVTPERFEMLKKIHDLGNCHFVGISDSQYRNVPVPFDGTVYNGIPMEQFNFTDEIKSAVGFLCVGRVVPQKGFDDAIEAVKATANRLMIAGQVFERKPEMLEFFDNKIKPSIDGGSVLLEPVLHRQHLIGHYQTSKALLFPIKWEEPFGLVMIEAMACGTPVIAYNRGSVPEIVKDGVTGFIIDPADDVPGQTPGGWTIKKRGVEGLIEAINRVGEIDRATCRKHVEQNFTLQKMVDGYVALYKKIIHENRVVLYSIGKPS